MFSTDRNDWIPAGELQVGEHLKTTEGDIEIAAIQLKAGVHQVYNLEVETDHCYFVSDRNVLSHNTQPCGAGKGLGGNPFKGKTPEQIDEMLKKKGYEPRGPDPVNGKGGYVNPNTGRSYHIDDANSFGEPPHVDVNRPRGYNGSLEKKKLPMGDEG